MVRSSGVEALKYNEEFQYSSPSYYCSCTTTPGGTCDTIHTSACREEKFHYMIFGPKCSMYTDFTGQEVSQSCKEKIEEAINKPGTLVYF